MSKIHFIADPHFGHQKIIEYENRPFSSAEEMDEVLINNWNRSVKKLEKVFVLGDFAISNKKRIKELVECLNGYKILIFGNHDRCYSYSWWKTSGFEEVIKYPVLYEEKYILSHEPVELLEGTPFINIYGHVHNHPSHENITDRSFCVSAERIGYAPIDFRKIQKCFQNKDINVSE